MRFWSTTAGIVKPLMGWWTTNKLIWEPGNNHLWICRIFWKLRKQIGLLTGNTWYCTMFDTFKMGQVKWWHLIKNHQRFPGCRYEQTTEQWNQCFQGIATNRLPSNEIIWSLVILTSINHTTLWQKFFPPTLVNITHGKMMAVQPRPLIGLCGGSNFQVFWIKSLLTHSQVIRDPHMTLFM